MEVREDYSKYMIPETGKKVDYATYRQITGKCETCGARMSDHPKCDACATLCGSGHLDYLPTPYRGQELCGHCIASWKVLNKLAGRETTWGEFQSPKPSMSISSNRRRRKSCL